MPAPTSATAPVTGVTGAWNYTLGSIVILYLVLDAMIVSDFLQRFGQEPSPLLAALLLLALACAAMRIRVCWFLRASSERGLPDRAWTGALLGTAAASWALAWVSPEVSVFAAVQLWLSGALLACFLRGLARWGFLLAVLAAVLVPLLAHRARGITLAEQLAGVQHWYVVMFSAMLPFMLFASLWLWWIVARLDESRQLTAELAVAQERLRFAADLHDIQGHHLQVIALKAELAERTFAGDPEQAVTQVGEIRLIAKEAMQETRSLVADLREIALEEELENARDMLTLAGADGELDVVGTPDHPAARRALAFVAREGTTNVLRHSQAESATITLRPERGGYTLVITNDGVVSDAANNHAATGSGLAGLRERVNAAGGTLSAGPVPGTADRYELRAWVPGTGTA